MRSIIFHFLFALLAFNSANAQFFGQAPYETSISRLKSDSPKSLTIQIKLTIPEGVHVYASGVKKYKIIIGESSGLGELSVKAPEAHDYKDIDDSIVKALEGNVVFVLTLPIIDAANWSLSGTFQSQACSATFCYTALNEKFDFKGGNPSKKIDLPSESKIDSAIKQVPAPKTEKKSPLQLLIEKFNITTRGSGFLGPSEFISFLSGKKIEKSGFQKETGAIWVILLTLLGGLALNLTPCVLPMIPINLAIIGAGVEAGSQKDGFVRGAVYGLGIALAYGILGLVVVFTGAKFGSINALWWFNFAVAAVFIVLSLAMFDVFIIDFSKYGAKLGVGDKRKGQLIPAFFMGVVAALLAGACVAPVVLSALILAAGMFANQNYLGLVLPFILGLGMALPWPFAGAGIGFLPKPGKWMIWVKKGFGVIIIFLAFKYAYFGYTLLPSAQSPEKEIEKLESELRRALNERQPVLIDFWASWCKSCGTMEVETFQNPEVKKELENYIVIKFQAENPNSPKIKAILDSFQVMGMPSYMVLKPKD